MAGIRVPKVCGCLRQIIVPEPDAAEGSVANSTTQTYLFVGPTTAGWNGHSAIMIRIPPMVGVPCLRQVRLRAVIAYMLTDLEPPQPGDDGLPENESSR